MYTSELGKAAQDGFTALWNQMRQDNNMKSAEAINGIQRALQCCGNTGPLDWGLSVPSSCCDEGANVCTIVNAFPKGCSTQLYDLVSTSGMLIAWISIVFAAFEVRTQSTR